jgi:hypothetical protein
MVYSEISKPFKEMRNNVIEEIKSFLTKNEENKKIVIDSFSFCAHGVACKNMPHRLHLPEGFKITDVKVPNNFIYHFNEHENHGIILDSIFLDDGQGNVVSINEISTDTLLYVYFDICLKQI